MRILLVFAVSVFVSGMTFGQQASVDALRMISQNFDASAFDLAINKDNAKDAINRLYFDEWTEADITDVNDETYSVDSLNIDIVSGVVYISEKDKIYRISNRRIGEVNVWKFKFKPGYSYSEKIGNMYLPKMFRVLHTGTKYDLLFNKKIVDVFEKSDHPMGITYKPSKRKKELKNVFLVYDHRKRTMTELPKFKRSILKYFGNYKKKVKQYARDRKLSYDEEKDLTEIFKYYDQLISKRSS